jgi:uncharacterized protein (TIGR02996 family)
LTSDHDALFAAVRAAPDDDLPRLVFADWLDETGHPASAARAAYIRLQVEAEHHPPGSSDRLELTRRAEELRPTFKDEWDRVFPPGELADTTVVRRRGFVDEVGTGLTHLRQSGNVMFAVAPIRELRLTGPTGFGLIQAAVEWESLGMMEYLARLPRLRIGPGEWEFAERSPVEFYRPAPLTHVARCPHLTALRRLDVAGNGLDDPWVVRFVSLFPASAFAGSLVELDLSDNEVTDAGANTLAAGRGLDRLGRLALTRNWITSAGVERLRVRFGDRVVV